MATIKLKDESTKTFSIDGVCYTKGDYRLQYNAKKEVLIIPKAVANISNLSGLPFKTPTAWTYFVDLDDNPYNSFEEFSLAISDAINFNLGGETPQYKVYTALLSQSGTSAPVATVLENTLGFDILWQYSTVGVYSVDYSIIFDSNKTACFISPNVGLAIISATAGPGFVVLSTRDYNGNPVNGGTNNILYLNKSLVEIRVYN